VVDIGTLPPTRHGEGTVPSPLELAGYVVTDEFLSADDCRQLLGQIDDYRSTTDLPEIHRATRGRDLRYLVIDGYEIRERFPDIWDLYTGSVRARMSDVAGEEMFPLQNQRAGVNVNVMRPGNSEYRWHYDRTPVTAVLYLNAVEGGATELYPGLRVLLSDQRRARTQRVLDRMVTTRLVRGARSRKVVVVPRARRYGLSEFDPLNAWLMAEAPAGLREPSVLHNDYHPPNLIVTDRAGLVILDWSFAGLGDHRLDLAWSALWTGEMAGDSTRTAFLAAYEAAAARPITDLGYYEALKLGARLLTISLWLRGAMEPAVHKITAEAIRGDYRPSVLTVYERFHQVTGIRLPVIERL